MVTVSQLRKEVIELRSLAELQAVRDVSQTIIYNSNCGVPDLSGITGTGTIILLADNCRDDVDLWKGPYIQPGDPEPSGPNGGAMVLNLKIEDCGVD